MTETEQRLVGAHVSKNTPLSLLYVIGVLAVVAGATVSLVASGNVGDAAAGDVVSTVAMAWQVLGNGLALLGALSLIGGAVAHAINWQIVNR
ncbi:hypothetical protein [Leifsonia sp. NPDC058248]|uniref:hypothetical protein n=1 Tax=Leifsonia sp. NPDC058248 TaxID=3346402 RepID=UPI0036DC0DE8